MRNSLPVVDQKMRQQEGGARGRRNQLGARVSSVNESDRGETSRPRLYDAWSEGNATCLLALAWASNGGYYLGCQQGMEMA